MITAKSIAMCDLRQGTAAHDLVPKYSSIRPGKQKTLYVSHSLFKIAAFGAADCRVHMAADALVEVASQMKALEARVTALSSSRHGSPTAAPAPATAGSINSGPQADTASSISFDKAVGGSLMPKDQPGLQSPSSGAGSGQSSQAVPGNDTSASAPSAAAGSAVTDREAASRAVPSTGLQGRAGVNVSLVPDLMTFSPALSTRPTGLNHQPVGTLLHPFTSLQQSQQAALSLDASAKLNKAHVVASEQQQQVASQPAAHSSQALVSGQQQIQVAAQVTPAKHAQSLQQPNVAAGLLQSDQAQLAGAAEKASTALKSSLLPDSRTGSPLPGGSFYNNAVFGSPTPTPSPHRDALGSEHSLLSPGSSPRPQQRALLHPSPPESKSVGESACCYCFSMIVPYLPSMKVWQFCNTISNDQTFRVHSIHNSFMPWCLYQRFQELSHSCRLFKPRQ